MTFPYAAVYDAIASGIMATGLPSDGSQLPPMLAFVMLEDGQPKDIDILPDTSVLFESREAKNVLGRFIRSTVGQIEAGDLPVCLVVVCEAWMKTVIHEPGAPLPEHGDLEADPEASEGVSIAIHHPEGMRIGFLPILPGREIVYGPLQAEAMHASGRLVSTNDEKAAASATKH